MSTDIVQQWREFVRTLRAVARTCGVDLVRDDSGQDKLRVVSEAIQASSATADQKERARKAFAAYEATFAATQTPTSDQDVAHIRFSLKAHSQNLA